MTIIYDVIAKRYEGSSRQDVVLFYDEDREKAIAFMKKYRMQNGYSIHESDGRFTIADIILRERLATGEEISKKSYREFFDVYGNRMEGPPAAG